MAVQAKPESQTITKMKSKVGKKGYGLYVENILTRKIFLPFKSVGSNIKENLQKILVEDLEGKCSEEGYIKNNSIRIMNYSSGELQGNNVYFHVAFVCLVCNPVEGMKLNVIAKNITKAGIRAETSEEISPIDVFISRDHNYMKKQYSDVGVGDEVSIMVIGQRFELNDPKISVLAELTRPPSKKSQKPKLTLKVKQ